MGQRSELTSTLPKLNIVAVNKLSCPFRGLRIIGAFDNNINEMPVRTDDISAVVCH